MPIFSILYNNPKFASCAARGRALQAMSLTPELFEAAAMQAVTKNLMAMKVAELKEELTARDEPVSGNKVWLPSGGGCIRRLCAITSTGPTKSGVVTFSAPRSQVLLLAFYDFFATGALLAF